MGLLKKGNKKLKMKILLVNKFYYIKGGCETYYFSLKKLLEEKNNKVIPFSMNHERNFYMQSANAAAHCTVPDCLLPSTTETRIYIWPVSRLSSFPFSHSKLFSPQASGYKQNEHNQMSLQIIPFVVYSDKSENGTRCSLLPSPCVSMY